ncbi:hypothetical protein [Parageobacillus sp. VR-IP]|uniref:hypothetical protein n=1 Tax=Parageobacillus sp. VR-IP TaxID=2742205 RepID=UPI0015817491|nr:hypothetical protein [Parageobacillus sp. VR-IP]
MMISEVQNGFISRKETTGQQGCSEGERQTSKTWVLFYSFGLVWILCPDPAAIIERS